VARFFPSGREIPAGQGNIPRHFPPSELRNQGRGGCRSRRSSGGSSQHQSHPLLVQMKVADEPLHTGQRLHLDHESGGITGFPRSISFRSVWPPPICICGKLFNPSETLNKPQTDDEERLSSRPTRGGVSSEARHVSKLACLDAGTSHKYDGTGYRPSRRPTSQHHQQISPSRKMCSTHANPASLQGAESLKDIIPCSRRKRVARIIRNLWTNFLKLIQEGLDGRVDRAASRRPSRRRNVAAICRCRKHRAR